MTQRQPNPPAHLKKHGKQFFTTAYTEYDIPDELNDVVLLMAELLDQYYHAKKTVDRDGQSYVMPTGQRRQLPEVQIMRECRSQFFQGIKLLGFNIEQEPKKLVGRPSSYSEPLTLGGIE